MQDFPTSLLSTHSQQPMFNNWQVVAQGWYIACPQRQLRKGQVKSLELCGQPLVVFRGLDGKVRALDAFCPHLGTNLGIGQVEGNWLRCAFHHWAFDGSGQCQQIPCQKHIPAKAKVSAYATAEKYGFIWIYPEATAAEELPEFEELQGKPVITLPETAFERSCHHHICMMNGIDVQHLKTIHQLDIQMELSIDQHPSGSQIDFTLWGELPQTTWRERLGRQLLGSHYEYSMRYRDGCIGMLTMMKQVRFLPPLHLIYAYTPIAAGRTRIQPIYVTKQRRGLIGLGLSYCLLLLTRLLYWMLRDEDGKIYDNIRFAPDVLLPIDAPLVEYMAYVNRLKPAHWSRQRES